MERREFLKSAAAVGVAGAGGFGEGQVRSGGAVSRPMSPDMQYRELGRTGEKVSAIGMGGFHIGKQKEAEESVKLIRAAVDRGITFLDNSWDYNDGISEVRMGKALRDGYRQKVFLMTKMDGRDKETYNKQLEESLGRLQTDMIDLVQFH